MTKRSLKNLRSFGTFSIVGAGLGGVVLALNWPRKPLTLSALDNRVPSNGVALERKLSQQGSEDRMELDLESPKEDAQIIPKPSTEIKTEDFATTLAAMAKVFLPGETGDWGMSLAVSDQELGDEPSVITRSQFRDVVSKHMATALPTGALHDSVLGLDLSALPLDGKSLKEALDDNRIVWDDVCAQSRVHSPKAWKRISFVLMKNSKSTLCALDRLREWKTLPGQTNELSVVFLDDAKGPQFGMLSAEDKAFHIQTWKPDWIEKVTAEWDNSPDILKKRALRLAQLARPLSYPSDVRISLGGGPHETFGHLLILSRTPAELIVEKPSSRKNFKVSSMKLALNPLERTIVLGSQGNTISVLK